MIDMPYVFCEGCNERVNIEEKKCHHLTFVHKDNFKNYIFCLGCDNYKPFGINCIHTKSFVPKKFNPNPPMPKFVISWPKKQ